MTLNILIGDGNWRPVSPGVIPTITTIVLPNATVGYLYSETLSATGTDLKTWSIVGGSISPLVLNSSTGSITGTPNVATTLSATFRASNAFGFDEETLSITVNVSGGPSLTTAPSISVWRAA